MTERQQRIIKYLKTRQAKSLPPPTIREIGDECGISSTSVVSYNLEKLVSNNLIIWHRFISRGVMLRDAANGEMADLTAENRRLLRQLQATQIQVKTLRRRLAEVQGAREL